MMNIMLKIPTPTNGVSSLWERIPLRSKWAFISTFLIGFLTHFYVMTNNIPNADSILAGPYHGPGDWELSIGRWAYRFAEDITSGFTLPVITGVISLLLVSLVSVLLISLFQIESKLIIVLFSTILVTFPVIAVNFSFLFTTDIFMMSFLCSVFSIYAIVKWGWKGSVLGALSLGLSMGLYQAYVGVTMTLSLMFLVFILIREKISLKAFASLAGKLLVNGVMGVSVYFIGLSVCLKIYNVTLSDYRGVSSMGQMKFVDIPQIIFSAYQWFWDFLFTSNIWMNSGITIFFNLIIFIGGMVLLVWNFIAGPQAKRPINIAIFCSLIVLIPLCLTAMKCLAYDTKLSPQMIPQYFMFYGFVLILVENPVERINNLVKANMKSLISWVLCLCCGILAYQFALTDNIAYSNLQLQYEKTYALALRVSDRIEQLPNYSNQLPICVVGSVPNEHYPRTALKHFEHLNSLELLSMETVLYTPADRSLPAFLRDYLGITSGNNLDVQAKERIYQLDRVKQMGIYPEQDSVQIIDNIVIVKLGKTE